MRAPFDLRFSQSLASLRHRPSHAKVRSTTQRLGRISKPLAMSERLTISTARPGNAFFCCLGEDRALIAAIREQPFQERISPEERLQNQNAAVAILNVGG